eukprot:EG_transcript_29985
MRSRGLLWLWLWLLYLAVVPPTVATPTLTVAPDTLAAGAQPSAWNVTLVNITGATPNLNFMTTLSVFVANPVSTPTVPIGGCSANYSTSTPQSLNLDLPIACALSGTVSFTVPAVYLAPNPSGSTTVILSGLSTSLSTTINYTATRTPTPSDSPTTTPSPTTTTTPSRTATLTGTGSSTRTPNASLTRTPTTTASGTQTPTTTRTGTTSLSPT